jgi:drug/metabolite transporter (DMT)-like permease
MTARGTLYGKLVLMAACWGGQFIAGRTLAPLVPHFTSGALRFIVACAGLVLLVRWREGGLQRPTRRQWAALVALGLTGIFLYNAFFFAALEIVPAGRAALMMALIPIGTAIGAWLVFRERMTPLRWFGIAISLAGAAVIVSRGDARTLAAGALGRGELMLILSVIGWVAYTLIGRVGPKGLSPLATTTWAALIGTVMLLAVAVFERPWARIADLSWQGWVSVIYLGIFGTVIAFLWYLEGVRTIGGPRTAVFINLVPVFGVTFAALILGEPVLASMVTGGLMVIAGVALTNRPAAPALVRQPG